MYWLESDKGFYKIGITGNIQRRLLDLKFEFDCEFKIKGLLRFSGDKENQINHAFEDFKTPIYKKNGKISTECFEINPIITHKLDKLYNGEDKSKEI